MFVCLVFLFVFFWGGRNSLHTVCSHTHKHTMAYKHMQVQLTCSRMRWPHTLHFSAAAWNPENCNQDGEIIIWGPINPAIPHPQNQSVWTMGVGHTTKDDPPTTSPYHVILFTVHRAVDVVEVLVPQGASCTQKQRKWFPHSHSTGKILKV